MARNTKGTELGVNVAATVEGDTLTLTFDLKADHGASKSGKTKIVATTNGFVGIPGHEGLILSLNMNRKK